MIKATVPNVTFRSGGPTGVSAPLRKLMIGRQTLNGKTTTGVSREVELGIVR